MERNEEWLIFALKKFLDMDSDDEFSPLHEAIISQRINTVKSGKIAGIKLEELEQELKNEGKL